MRGILRLLLLCLPLSVVTAERDASALPGMGGSSAGGLLLVEVTPLEGAIQVAQAWFPVPEAGSRRFPLLLPERGPVPSIRPPGPEDSTGIQTRGRGGARAEFRDGAVWLAGQPDGKGDFGLEIVYRVPVETSRILLQGTVTAPLERVQVIHPGGPHALHVRPLRPYGYREEDEGDGAWRYQDIPGPIETGEVLRIAVGRLPEARRPYRWAAAALLGLVGLLAWLLGRRA